jgi:hypothetical protein
MLVIFVYIDDDASPEVPQGEQLVDLHRPCLEAAQHH